ncbi:MAG TPA: CHASE4 domain-containing protein [Candidatus Thermoplasmatota archaeon]|nr:CHASE4 domain-containing protein [Candidatus Thermoplasmatota archaeon]
MKLRTKTFIIICVVSVILSTLLSVTLNNIITNGYVDIEKDNVAKNVERVLNELHQETTSLVPVGHDWSTWDDTYNFINNTNEEYIQGNVNYNSLYQIRVNFMLFYNNANTLVFAKAFDFQQGNETHLPESLYMFIDVHQNSLFIHPTLEYSQSGIILYNKSETPLIISITPILHSNGEGPIQGTLILGRYLDQERLVYIQNMTELSVIVRPLSSQFSPEFRETLSYDNDTPLYIHPLNASYIAGYVTINDVLGHPIFTLEIGSNRYIYHQGALLIQNLIISLFIIMIVFIILILLIIDRFVTSRLDTLTKSINEVKGSRDLRTKLQITGNDEITALEKKIDSMLTSLHKAWTLKDITESNLKKKVDELERFKVITIDREIKMIQLKKQLRELQENHGEKF